MHAINIYITSTILLYCLSSFFPVLISVFPFSLHLNTHPFRYKSVKMICAYFSMYTSEWFKTTELLEFLQHMLKLLLERNIPTNVNLPPILFLFDFSKGRK